MTVEDGDILRITLNYTMNNTSAVQNVFTWRLEGGPVDDEDVLSDVANWVLAEWADAWADFASAEANLTSVEVDVLLPTGHVDHNVGNVEIDVDGAVSGETVSSAFSGLFTAYTSLPKTRGSKYVPGASRDGVADNALGSVLLAALAALAEIAITDYVGSVSGERYNMGVLSRTLEQFVPFNGSFLTTDEPSYQRRRKRSRGA